MRIPFVYERGFHTHHWLRKQTHGIIQQTYTNDINVYINALILYLTLHSAVQERLTKQIAQAIVEAVQPHGVAVVVEGT